MNTLALAENFIASQGLHLLSKEDIPKYAHCAEESYGNIDYALNNYFVGHPCTKDEFPQ